MKLCCPQEEVIRAAKDPGISYESLLELVPEERTPRI